jgi:hypothetical protein
MSEWEQHRYCRVHKPGGDRCRSLVPMHAPILNCASSTMNDCRVSRSNPMYPMSSHVCRPRALVSAPERREACRSTRRAPGVRTRRSMHAPEYVRQAPEYARAGVCAGICAGRRMSSALRRGSMHASGVRTRRSMHGAGGMHAPGIACTRRSMHARRRKYENRAGVCDAPGVGEYAPGVCTRQRCTPGAGVCMRGVCMRRRRAMSGVCSEYACAGADAPGARAMLRSMRTNRNRSSPMDEALFAATAVR